MHVVAHPDAGAFLEATAAFRAADPVQTNVIGSVATSVRDGRRYDAYRWLTVEEDGAVVGVALRTSPWNALVSPMPLEAAALLGAHLAVDDPAMPGITGPRAVALAVLEAAGWSDRATITIDERLRVLGTYVPPRRPASGASRPVTIDDVDLVIAWMHQFAVDAGLAAHNIDDSTRERVLAGAMWLWEDAGRPVAIAGHAPLVDSPVGTVARLGPVYTPADLRGRGYGTSITAAVVEALRPRCAILMLATDADNPTSNGIYAELGFAEVAELVEISLAPAGS